MNKQCPVCLNNFGDGIFPCVLKKRTYCSNACRFESRKKQVLTSCPICSKLFKVTSWQISRTSTSTGEPCKIYCSKECSFIGRRKKERVFCGFCLKPFQSHFSRKSKFCSVDCFREFNKGDNHYLWGGDNVTYRVIHHWVSSNFGKADHCDFCGGESSRYHWANIDHRYQRNPQHWLQLCTRCHGSFDSIIVRSKPSSKK